MAASYADFILFKNIIPNRMNESSSGYLGLGVCLIAETVSLDTFRKGHYYLILHHFITLVLQ